MSDKDWKIQMPESVRDSIPPEMLAQAIAEMQTTLVTGGIDGLLAMSRQVVFIDSILAPCLECGGALKAEEGWDSYVCDATPECERYSYYPEESETAQTLSERASEIDRAGGAGAQ